MTGVNLIYVGNTREKYFLDAFAEYEKRLSSSLKVNNIEIKEEKLPENASEAEVKSALEKEGARILASVPPKSALVSLCVEGKSLTSEEFAADIERLLTAGHPSVSFVIGSSYGLCDEVKKKSLRRISLSKMTFTHRIARLLLLEQIYRAHSIISGGKYHK